MPTVAQQRQMALQKANGVRSARAQLKRKVAIGEVDARALLAKPPDLILGVKVGDFLKWAPKVGVIKSAKITKSLAIAPSTPIRRLSVRMRATIAERLP